MPQKSARRLQTFLPIATPSFRNTCYFLFNQAIRKRVQTLDKEFFIHSSETTIEGLNNGSRRHAVAYVMLSNGNTFIAQTSCSFRKYNRAWIGEVYDCYILRCRRLDEMPKKIDHKESDNIVNDSDRDSILGDPKMEGIRETEHEKLLFNDDQTDKRLVAQ